MARAGLEVGCGSSTSGSGTDRQGDRFLERGEGGRNCMGEEGHARGSERALQRWHQPSFSEDVHKGRLGTEFSGSPTQTLC